MSSWIWTTDKKNKKREEVTKGTVIRGTNRVAEKESGEEGDLDDVVSGDTAAEI